MKNQNTPKKDTLIIERREEEFRKDKFWIDYAYYKIEQTGETYTDEKLSDLNLNQLYNQYRVRNHIPFPEEIIHTREKYGLSQAKMAEVLGIGVNNYRGYETGDIPSSSNSTLIKFAEDPYKFRDLVDMKKDLFSQNEYNKTLDFINQEIKKMESGDDWESLFKERAFAIEEPNELTGYKLPNIEKVENMILFFIENCNGLWTTKLNKLLFYGDFLHFKRTGSGISGTAYHAISFGPVPYKYHNIYDHVQDRKKVEAFEELIGETASGYKFRSVNNSMFNSALFSDAELSTLKDVVKLLGDKTVKQIVDISHLEDGWKECQEQKNFISYREYGVKLKIS